MSLLESIHAYEKPERAKQLITEHPSLNIAGPSGAGKGTMVQYLVQSREYAPVVSDTTRDPRPFGNGLEVNGVHYWFIDEQTAIAKLADGAYIEVKAVHGDTLYGTSIASYERVLSSGQTPILEIDVQGMKDLMEEVPGFESILLLPPDFATWEHRIDGRGDMTQEQKVRRFTTAVMEYGVVFENDRFHPVVNTEVIDTAEIIRSGEYKNPEYREYALKVAGELRSATQAFLDSNKQSLSSTH